MSVQIVSNRFDPWLEIQSFEQAKGIRSGGCGATSVFIGTMRDFNEGSDIQGMYLEHYPGMTEKQIEKIIIEAETRWQIIDALVIHRVGHLLPNDDIVLVVVWSSHRGDAFDTSRFIMEALKSKAPFWKKEQLVNDQERWVLTNTDGYKK